MASVPCGAVGQQRVTAGCTVDDLRLAHDQQLPVKVVEHGVADLGGIGIGQRRAGRSRLASNASLEGPAVPASTISGTGTPARAVRKVRYALMLDLLQPGDRQARPGVPVQHEPARLGQQPGVSRIPAINLDTEASKPIRSAYLGGLEPRHRLQPSGQRPHVAGADAGSSGSN